MEGNDTLGIGPIDSKDKYNQPTSPKKKDLQTIKIKKCTFILIISILVLIILILGAFVVFLIIKKKDESNTGSEKGNNEGSEKDGRPKISQVIETTDITDIIFDTEISEKIEKTYSTKIIDKNEKTEEIENTQKPGSNGISEKIDNSEITEKIKNTETSENIEITESNIIIKNTGKENTEGSETVENSENNNIENSEKIENTESNTVTEKYKIISKCIIGDNELCKNCDANTINECGECNEGYYLPSNSYNKTICDNCNKIEGCLECSGKKENPVCSKCLNGLKLEDNICIEESCILGEKEKCKTCKNEIGKKKECETCNDGYYLWGDGNYECLKCSVKNCKKCSRNLTDEICEECNENFILNKDNSCICPSDHILDENGKCRQYGNWIEAEYNITDNKSVFDFFLLDQGNPPYINLDEIDMYINDTKIPILLYNYRIYHNFTKLGEYKIKIHIKKTLYSMSYMFMNIDTLKKITFLEGFDASKVRDMSYMFCGCTADTIDMTNLKTDSLTELKKFLWGASHLEIFKISNSFNTSKVKYMQEMFYANRGLKELDLSNIDTSNIVNCRFMFKEIPIYTVIKISNKFTKCREFIPYENTIINVDDIACKSINHCERCIGSMETLSCSKCQLGYVLKDNICVQPKCIIGNENNCKECQNITEKENECLSCNEGYYLSTNSLTKTKCDKCPTEGCKTCNANTGNCLECKKNYKPIFEKNDEKIISCEIMCDIGDENKCAVCNEEKGKENQCSICNKGYRLMKDGTCKKIENSFIATYNVVSVNKPTLLMKSMIGHINLYQVNLSEIEAYIGDKKIDITICNYYFCYQFDKLGLIEVKIIINKTLQTMEEMFYYYDDNLIEIKFSDTFDTSHVLTMESMFQHNYKLRSANLSSFNTTLCCSMLFMFKHCYELTSIDLSNFDTKNVITFQDLFNGAEALSYVDISSFNTKQAYRLELFKGVSGNGTIIVNKTGYDLDIPNGWTIIYKE